MKQLLPSLAVLTLLCHCAAPTGTSGGNKAALATATKEQPFVNSLGMKFVPVPGTKILMCITETTVDQYKAAGLRYGKRAFEQSGNHPAVKVSWNDAKSWSAWLSAKEGRKYRLPNEAEWSKAVGTTTYPWGDQWPPPNNCGNYAGQELRGMTESERKYILVGKRHAGAFPLIGGFSDRHKFTAPVGSYPANSLGIHDLGGNVWEWCENWFDASHKERVMRGGAWDICGNFESRGGIGDLRSDHRHGDDPDGFFYFIHCGFRIVVEK